jgi:hypothetical protein
MDCSYAAEHFMNTTRTARTALVSAILILTGMNTCPFPVVDRAEAWFRAFADDHDAAFLLDGVTHGFRYDFVDPNPGGAFYRVPNYVPIEHEPKVSAWVDAEIAAGRYAPIADTFARGYAALGVVDKDHSGMAKVRTVHDLSRPTGTSTNLGISIEHCSLPTVKDAFNLLRPRWFQAKVDLTSAYRSVPTHPDHWAHQCGEWAGQGFADLSLPFGVRSAVPLFDRLTQALVRKLRSEGIPAALGYIDDFWVTAETEAECLLAYERLIELLLDLGFVVNRAKCVLPTTRLIFLGIELDSDANGEGICRMTIPLAKRLRGAKLCEDFLARVPATGGAQRGTPFLTSQWDAIRGFLGHCASVVFDGRLYMAHLHHAWWFARGTVLLPPAWLALAMRADISWWLKLFQSSDTIQESASHHRTLSHYAFFATDACTSWGMGAFMGGDSFKMSWEQLARDYTQTKVFPNCNEPLGRGHVNYLELFAAYWALCKWGKELAGHLVVLHIDSMVALYCLQSMSSKTLVFIPLLRAIAKLLLQHDIRLKLTYISTTANVLADSLSRGGLGFQALLNTWYTQLPSLKRDFEDWMLHTTHFQSLDKRYGPITITACADPSGRNSHTSRYWSSVDSCMDHLWYNMLVWCNPPFSMIAQILRHFIRCKLARPMGTAMLLLVPVWTDQDWYKCIQAMPDMFVRVRWWKKYADLFSAPPLGPGANRKIVGNTRWPVHIYYAHPGAVIDTPPAAFMAIRP